MGADDRAAAFELFRSFLRADPHYRAVAAVYGDGGPEALRSALDLFIARPELGFVWIARRETQVVGCCVVCFAISTSRGTLVAKLDDVNVRPGREGEGIGSAMMDCLKNHLRGLGVTRIDTATHVDNPGARRFYERHGFASLREERLSCLLEASPAVPGESSPIAGALAAFDLAKPLVADAIAGIRAAEFGERPVGFDMPAHGAQLRDIPEPLLPFVGRIGHGLFLCHRIPGSLGFRARNGLEVSSHGFGGAGRAGGNGGARRRPVARQALATTRWATP